MRELERGCKSTMGEWLVCILSVFSGQIFARPYTHTTALAVLQYLLYAQRILSAQDLLYAEAPWTVCQTPNVLHTEVLSIVMCMWRWVGWRTMFSSWLSPPPRMLSLLSISLTSRKRVKEWTIRTNTLKHANLTVFEPVFIATDFPRRNHIFPYAHFAGSNYHPVFQSNSLPDTNLYEILWVRGDHSIFWKWTRTRRRK